MATRVVVIWVLVLSVAWSGAFAFFYRYFDGLDVEKLKTAHLEQELNHKQREIAKLTMGYREYKDALAKAGIKIKTKTPWDDPKRSIASEISDNEYQDLPVPQPGNVALKKAKRMFLASNYMRSAEMLEQFLQVYPDNPNLPQAYYLLAESYFQNQQIEAAIRTIDRLVEQFPETEYAGLGLVRLAGLFVGQERQEEASELYKTVIDHFPGSQAALVAKNKLAELNP